MSSRELRLTQAERMGARLGEGTVEAVVGGARAAAERNDELVREPIAALRAEGRLACVVGCTSCCRLTVSVSFAEAALLADFVERTFSAQQRAALTERLVAHCDAVAGTSLQERNLARRPCPLLVDDRCSAYEARPLACRGWNSASVEPCLDDAAHPEARLKVPVHGALRTTALEIAEGLRDAARERGLDDSALDMPQALLDTLPDVAGATRRWLDGAAAPERQRLDRRR